MAGQEMPIRPGRGLREAGFSNQSCNILELKNKTCKKHLEPRFLIPGGIRTSGSLSGSAVPALIRQRERPAGAPGGD